MSVQEYLDKHMLSRRIEDAVNAAVRAKAADPVLYISNHMRRATPSAITKVKARKILDSRGIPTVEVDLYTNKGMYRATAASVNLDKIYDFSEAREGELGKYVGNTVSKFVKHINERIAEALIGLDPTVQSQIDRVLVDLVKEDPKSELGPNATVAVSIAACKAGAAEKEVPLSKHIADLSGQSRVQLPVPAINVINGGKRIENNIFAQDIMILPVGANTFEEAMEMVVESYSHLKAIVLEKYGQSGCSLGERDGLAPNVSDLKEALDLVKEAIDEAGFHGRIKMAVAVGVANLRDGNNHKTTFKSTVVEDLVRIYTQLCSDYSIVSIEDPFDENDWESFKQFTQLGVCQVVGDQLLISEPKHIDRAISESACNALLLKMNHLGTVTEAIELANKAKMAQWGLVVSHTRGETEDTFVADLAAGVGAGLIKAGGPCRGELLSNQLLRIEDELGEQAAYAGENWRPCP
ncbi:cytosolic enolase [Wolffia australiana]